MALSSPCPSKPQSALLTLLQATSSTPDSEPTGLRWRLAVEKETCPPTSLPTGVNAETQAPKPPIALAASEILQPKLSSGVSAPSFCWFTQLTGFESPTKHDLSASITQNHRARYCCYSQLRASLPVHSFCSSAFAFATQHPALESDLYNSTNLSSCYISKDRAFHSILAQSRALEQDLP